MSDKIRILRLIEYVGPRTAVEEQVSRSLHSVKQTTQGVYISVTTLGEFAEDAEGLLKATPIYQMLDPMKGE